MNTSHVQTCQECQAQIARLREEVTQLRVALGLIEPPPSLFVGPGLRHVRVEYDRPGNPPPRIGIL
jgi:hypothetical protein